MAIFCRMTILSSREHSCIHPEVSVGRDKNEECRRHVKGLDVSKFFIYGDFLFMVSISMLNIPFLLQIVSCTKSLLSSTQPLFSSTQSPLFHLITVTSTQSLFSLIQSPFSSPNHSITTTIFSHCCRPPKRCLLPTESLFSLIQSPFSSPKYCLSIHITAFFHSTTVFCISTVTSLCDWF